MTFTLSTVAPHTQKPCTQKSKHTDTGTHTQTHTRTHTHTHARTHARTHAHTHTHTHTHRTCSIKLSLSSAALIYTASTNSISLHADHAHSPGSFHCHYRCCCFKQRLNKRPEEDKFRGSARLPDQKNQCFFYGRILMTVQRYWPYKSPAGLEIFEALCDLQNPLCKAKERTNWGCYVK